MTPGHGGRPQPRQIWRRLVPPLALVLASVLVVVGVQVWAASRLSAGQRPDESLICRDHDGSAARSAIDALTEGESLPITELTDFTWDTAWYLAASTDLEEMSRTMGGVDLGPDFDDRIWCAWTGVYFVDDGDLVHVWSFSEGMEYTPAEPGTQWYPGLTFRRTDGRLQHCDDDACT